MGFKRLVFNALGAFSQYRVKTDKRLDELERRIHELEPADKQTYWPTREAFERGLRIADGALSRDRREAERNAAEVRRVFDGLEVSPSLLPQRAVGVHPALGAPYGSRSTAEEPEAKCIAREVLASFKGRDFTKDAFRERYRKAGGYVAESLVEGAGYMLDGGCGSKHGLTGLGCRPSLDLPVNGEQLWFVG